VSIVGAAGRMCVVLSENGIFLIFGLQWPLVVLVFWLSKKFKNVQDGSDMTGTQCGLFTHTGVVIFESPSIMMM
jgi:hypothetical protein